MKLIEKLRDLRCPRRQDDKWPTWTVSFYGRRVRSGRSGSRCGSGRVRMQHMTGVDETGWHESLVAVAMSQHPEPIWIVAIQHRHEFPSLDAHVVLVTRHERVEDDISASRGILRNRILPDNTSARKARSMGALINAETLDSGAIRVAVLDEKLHNKFETQEPGAHLERRHYVTRVCKNSSEYLEERMHVRLRRYRLYRVLGLRDVGAIDVDVRSSDVVTRVALAVRRRAGVGLLYLL